MSRSESRLALFRQEAIEFQGNNRQWGQVARLQPLSTKLLTWFVTTAVVLIITFLFLGQYARKEKVAGYLTPTSGTAKIFAPQQEAGSGQDRAHAVPRCFRPVHNLLICTAALAAYRCESARPLAPQQRIAGSPRPAAVPRQNLGGALASPRRGCRPDVARSD
jgi:hypothetical protein